MAHLSLQRCGFRHLELNSGAELRLAGRLPQHLQVHLSVLVVGGVPRNSQGFRKEEKEEGKCTHWSSTNVVYIILMYTEIYIYK